MQFPRGCETFLASNPPRITSGKYAFAPSGEAPSHRVGHTCLYVPDPDTQGKGKVVIVGGADPSRCYSDAHIINLDTYEWINPDWKDLLPRYEHACFTYFSDPTRIWVFGGAEQAENRNSIQVISPVILFVCFCMYTVYSCMFLCYLLELASCTGQLMDIFSPMTSHCTMPDTRKSEEWSNLYYKLADLKGSRKLKNNQRLYHCYQDTCRVLRHESATNISHQYIHDLCFSGHEYYPLCFSEGLSWKNPNVEGLCPSPRTFHTSSSAIGDKFYVFGGGEKGAEPAADNKLHVFDTVSLTWMQPVTSGDPPKPRHGHTITAVGSKLFIHGGMAGSSFFSDLFCIDTDTMAWEQLRTKGEPPPPCAAHSSVCWENFIYIFGGMTEAGPISTMYRFDTGMQANANESSKLE
ncbi:rab9 effector protein with kelch motifs-like [Eleutherodactylus coqui]|uniref:rab9 effector protein with kelch motifs-like n=1 Tax=Eleutherodactylus coqui TaxID=57060 RepID=UPI0034629B71